MDIAYIIHSGKCTDLVELTVASLRKFSDCEIYFYTAELEDQHRLEKYNIDFFDVPKEQWDNRMMTCKIEMLKTLELEEGDRVMVLDSDLLIQSDPFKVFDEEDFDVFYTTRDYVDEHPTNGGVWGFVNNEKSQYFLDLFINQIHNPTWQPLLDYRKHFKRKDGDFNWWVDQDFMCICHLVKNDFDLGVKLYDAGYKYNYTMSLGRVGMKAFWDTVGKLGHPNYSIIHFKGQEEKKFFDDAGIRRYILNNILEGEL